MKIIFVTGGSISGLGKGVTSSSIGKLLSSTGRNIGMIKMDPYLQLDAGTMSPYEHGEVFVTADGGECDLDIGNYERFVGNNLSRENNITTGKVYLNVINKERNGDFLGKTVQLFPHIPNEINILIKNIASKKDITIVEVGGTIGDIENAPFLEAIRILKRDLGEHNVACAIVAPLLHLSYSGELKTKLIQNSVKELRKTGLIPDVLFCRSEVELDSEIKEKISRTCDIPLEGIIEAKNVQTVYQVPEYFKKQGLLEYLSKILHLGNITSDLNTWNSCVDAIIHSSQSISIAIVGKYTAFEDTYKSITEALIHAGAFLKTQINIKWIDSEKLEEKNASQIHDKLKNISGILIPGGFGERGVEGMITVSQYARENNIPFLGICLGMQVAVIDYARNVCGIQDAHSSEFNNTSKNYVIDLMDEQKDIESKGATMRLGNYDAILQKNSLAQSLYSTVEEYSNQSSDNFIITERHRHRYEVNPDFHSTLIDNGLSISGVHPQRGLAEFIEIGSHPFYIATQAHPEFKSRLEKPHPLFVGLIKAGLKKESERLIA